MPDYTEQLRCACTAARCAGDLLLRNFGKVQTIDERSEHDIKLRIDKDCQQLIQDSLAGRFPDYAFLGEEGGDGGETEWIADPLDGTVNYYYGLPFFCVSIALRVHGCLQLGCVYAPVMRELYTAVRGGRALLNGRPIRVSDRNQMCDAVVFAGHGAHGHSDMAGLHRFARISARVCKVRILGSAALSLCYIAAGRLDAYIEQSIRLWDFAAARVILEAAGGTLDFTPCDGNPLTGSILAYNGKLPMHEFLNSCSDTVRS